jgi:hypothetical protein
LAGPEEGWAGAVLVDAFPVRLRRRDRDRRRQQDEPPAPISEPTPAPHPPSPDGLAAAAPVATPAPGEWPPVPQIEEPQFPATGEGAIAPLQSAPHDAWPAELAADGPVAQGSSPEPSGDFFAVDWLNPEPPPSDVPVSPPPADEIGPVGQPGGEAYPSGAFSVSPMAHADQSATTAVAPSGETGGRRWWGV